MPKLLIIIFFLAVPALAQDDEPALRLAPTSSSRPRNAGQRAPYCSETVTTNCRDREGGAAAPSPTPAPPSGSVNAKAFFRDNWGWLVIVAGCVWALCELRGAKKGVKVLDQINQREREILAADVKREMERRR